MTSVKEHYDRHLGSIYTWMLGDFEAARGRCRELLTKLDLEPAASGWAVDLGCGSGVQALALADLGFQVLAVDGCAALVEELTERAGDTFSQTQRAIK